jgi:hypothetical protein
MKKNFFYALAIFGLGFSLAGCRLTDRQTNSNPSGGSQNPQPVQQAAPTAAALDQSAGQVDQSLNDLGATLQAIDTGDSLDTTQLDQSLSDLQNSLQATDVPVPTPDTLDQDLNSLQQALQAEQNP